MRKRPLSDDEVLNKLMKNKKVSTSNILTSSEADPKIS
jgi:hypothetical protein